MQSGKYTIKKVQQIQNLMFSKRETCSISLWTKNKRKNGNISKIMEVESATFHRMTFHQTNFNMSFYLVFLWIVELNVYIEMTGLLGCADDFCLVIDSVNVLIKIENMLTYLINCSLRP